MTLSIPDQPQSLRFPDPGRLVRLTSVARAMLDEARSTPCDPAGCARFREIYEQTVASLAVLLPADLRTELGHLRQPFLAEAPSPSELRVAQAELVGWLEGLFHGLTAAAVDRDGHADAPAGSEGWPGHYL